MEKQLMPLLPQPVASISPISMVVTDEETANTSVNSFFTALGRWKWKILTFVFLSVVATGCAVLRMRPLYEATAKIEIDHPGGGGVVGPEAGTNNNPVNDMDQIVTTNLEAITAGAVLRPVVERYHLLEEEGQLKGKTEKQINDLRRGAVTLAHLQVKRPPNSYVIEVSYRAHNATLAADVANAIATAYADRSTELQVQTASDRAAVMEGQIAELKTKMLNSGKTLASFEKELGILDPDQKTNLLTTRLNQLTAELTTAQDEGARRGAAVEAIRAKTVAAAQSTAQGETLARLKEKLNEARQRFAQVKTIYGPNHAEYRKAESEVTELTGQLAEDRSDAEERVTSVYEQSLNHEKSLAAMISRTKGEMDGLSGTRHRYEQLKGEADGDKQLYNELNRRIKEYQINGAFRHSLAHVIDPALPSTVAVFPKVPMFLGGALLVSLVLGIVGALIFDSFDQTLAAPEQVMRDLKIEVLGALPEVKRQAAEALATPGLVLTQASAMRALSQYEGAIRTVRNMISLIDFDPDKKSILFTSALESEGKSTTLAQLARAYGAQSQRILVIDGDLRRPTMHKRLNIGYEPTLGLGGVLEGSYSWKDAVIPVPSAPNLSLLPAGEAPTRNPADLVTSGIAKLIRQASREYDLVLVDAPPLFGCAETLQMSVAVDSVVLVTRAGHTSGKLVMSAIANLQRFRGNLLGVILNRVDGRNQQDAYGYGYGQGPRPAQKQIEAPRPVLG
jgi:polysaccharide biosynthesis transport protein